MIKYENLPFIPDKSATVDECFEKTKNIIFYMAKKYWKRYDGKWEWNEIVAECSYGWAWAFSRYRYNIHLALHLFVNIQHHMSRVMQSRNRLKRQLPDGVRMTKLRNSIQLKNRFDLYSFMLGMSDDAQRLIRVGLERINVGGPLSFSTVRIPAERWGWSTQRIKEAYNETQEVLGELNR